MNFTIKFFETILNKPIIKEKNQSNSQMKKKKANKKEKKVGLQRKETFPKFYPLPDHWAVR